jgi:hypothetical protein
MPPGHLKYRKWVFVVASSRKNEFLLQKDSVASCTANLVMTGYAGVSAYFFKFEAF